MGRYEELIERWIGLGIKRADMVLLVVAFRHPEVLRAVNSVYDRRKVKGVYNG